MQTFIKPTVVEAFVKGRKVKGQMASITFVKQDGSLRKINGCFAPLSHIIGSERGIAQGEAMKKRGQIPMYSVADKAWKSFYADKVVEIA